MLKLSNLLSLQLTLFQELKLPTTKCSKEDFSLTQMPTDIDSVETILKFQSTAHTELNSTMDKEMGSLPSMETEEVPLTTSQTWTLLLTTTVLMLSINKLSVEPPVDLQILTKTLFMSKLEISTESSLKKKEKPFAEILLDQ